MKREPLHRSAELPVLEVIHPDGRQERHSVLGREVTIGRDRSNRVCIRHHFVSKFHAKIIVRDRNFKLVDLGSANNTRVNGSVVSESPLFFGDELQFAGIRGRFVLPSQQRRGPSAGVGSPPRYRAPSNGTAREADASESLRSAERKGEPTLDKREVDGVGSAHRGFGAVMASTGISDTSGHVSWAGPLDVSDTRRFRAVFFGILIGIVAAVLVTGRSLLFW